MAVDSEAKLPSAVGGAYPGALDGHPSAPEGDLAALVTVAHGRVIRVVLPPLADDLGDLLLHQLGQDTEPAADR